MKKEQEKLLNLLVYLAHMSSEAGACGQHSVLRSVCMKLQGVVFAGAAQMYKHNWTSEMLTACRSDHCLGKSRNLLII